MSARQHIRIIVRAGFSRVNALALILTACACSPTPAKAAVDWLSPRLPRNQSFEKQLTLFTQNGNQALTSRQLDPVQLSFKSGNFSLAPILLAKKKAGHAPALALLDHRETVTLGSAAERSIPFLASQLVVAVKQTELAGLEKSKNWNQWIATQKLGIPLLSDRTLFLLAQLLQHPLYRRLPGGVQANRDNYAGLQNLQRAVNAKNLVLNIDRETQISRWINGEFSAIWCFSDDLNELRARSPFPWTEYKSGILTPQGKRPSPLWQVDLVLLQNNPSSLFWLENSAAWLRTPAMREGFALAGFFPPSAKDPSHSVLPADEEWIQIQTAWIKAMAKFFVPNQSPEVSQFLTSIDQDLSHLKP